MTGLTHLDELGRARMVDVGAKPETERVAVARGRVRMLPGTLALVRAGEVAKGDVLAVARVAGIMAAKRTGDLIPLCHPLPVTSVEVQIDADETASTLEIEATAAGGGFADADIGVVRDNTKALKFKADSTGFS